MRKEVYRMDVLKTISCDDFDKFSIDLWRKLQEMNKQGYVPHFLSEISISDKTCRALLLFEKKWKIDE